ncbi:alpha/beta fold hydrolase [Roseibacterium sp. SDUM158017]|uniref:esterase/lipase family protein n=1 Tax=Roseicyclus salinarum TaxID=3036773 RepID=UPI0024154510|nr:alpha/beta fold hydrolase [Roseibacterium sp. SDUM158017]MDG4647000.1 alpha/beta fold hydrolase [Roseibacterium sp. SDUM158017]
MAGRIWIGFLAVVAIAAGLFFLERPRTGLEIRELRAGPTPITLMQEPGADGPLVVIAHGFAGSRQLMAAYQLTLARAGYVTASFDFEGHGRNPVPMSGDVTSVDGTTRLLMDEMARVTDAVLAETGAEPRVALLGHSMASDIVVRQGVRDARVEAIVGISLFSQAVTEELPRNLLIVNGALEGMLRQEARRVMAAIGAEEGETAGTPGEGFARRAVAAPFVEHVGVLYSPTALAEARAWLDRSFGRSVTAAPVAAIGPAILLALLGVVLLARALGGALPEGRGPAQAAPGRFWIMAALPAAATPLLLAPFDTRFLPVLVADYLALHLAVYGALVLAVAAWAGTLPARRGWIWGLALAAYGLIAFGGVMDRYVASFFPVAGRIPIVAAILPGAILAMLADAVLLEAGRARLWRRWTARFLFLASLGIAMALDFERLFFLLIILPVILLFYLSFGLMGGWVGRRTGSVMAMGLGLGIILGWALGVTFPLFDPGA